MPQKIGKAVAYAVLIWIIGFIWGSIVFMTPALKNTAAIPYVSRNPVISFPILIIWIPVAWLLARSYLKTTGQASREGIRLGLTFSLVNFVLDLLVLVFMLKTGWQYFLSLTVWTAYLLLTIVPWLAGRALERANA